MNFHGKQMGLAVIVAIVWVCLLPHVSLAQSQKKPLLILTPSLQLEETYDSNVLQSRTAAEDDYLTTAIPRLEAELNLPKFLSVSAGYSPKILYYLDHDDLNEVFHEVSLNLGLAFDWAKAKAWRNFRVGTDFAYDPVQVSMVNSTNTSINTTQRLMAAIIPGYLLRLSPKTSIDTELRAQREMFLGGEGEDSDLFKLDTVFRQKVSRRLFFRLGADGTYQDFENSGTTLLYGGHTGFDIEIVKRLKGGANVGFDYIDLPGNRGNNHTYTVDVNLDYSLSKRTELRLLGNRQIGVDINNNGNVISSVNFEVRHRLSQKTLWGLLVFYNFSEQESLINNRPVGDNLKTMGGLFRVQYTEHWTFGLKTARDQNAGENSITDYSQNRLAFEIRYQYPLKF